MKKRQKKKDDKRRGKKGNGKMVNFPQQPPQGITQPPPTDEQLAMQKRIEVAGDKVLEAISGLSLIEVKGTLETVNGFLQRRVMEVMSKEKMEAPSADDTAKT